ncbi:MAG: hypothetical protein CME61_08260 [Halobacteriovoraceae bacterium]|nr:hypothetical protein [Halobacteriovoraceae bacterium]
MYQSDRTACPARAIKGGSAQLDNGRLGDVGGGARGVLCINLGQGNACNQSGQGDGFNVLDHICILRKSGFISVPAMPSHYAFGRRSNMNRFTQAQIFSHPCW